MLSAILCSFLWIPAVPVQERTSAATKADSEPAAPSRTGLLEALERERRVVAERLRAASIAVMVNGDGISPPVRFSGTLLDGKGTFAAPTRLLQGARMISARTHDDRIFVAHEITRVADSPLSLLRLECDVAPPAPRIGASAAVAVGDFVALVASPYGFESTTSFGTVSGIKRQVAQIPRIDLLQTNLSAVEGAIGGVLGNSRGEVVGVLVGGPELDNATAEITLSGSGRTRELSGETASRPASVRIGDIAFEERSMLRAMRFSATAPAASISMSLAVPVTHLMAALASLPADAAQPAQATKSSRRVLGVLLNENIDPLLRTQLRLPVSGGLVVEQVFEASPASRAGLKAFDILLSIHGEALQNNEHFRELLQEMWVPRGLKFELLRGGSRMTLDVPSPVQGK
ncbi:MAG: trypsin-like peptidase domain-containing protein [Planctomycetes bacterium]|nr:trypsin-like peptidase domain-containing protein [Planctomycetota bacterium]